MLYAIIFICKRCLEMKKKRRLWGRPESLQWRNKLLRLLKFRLKEKRNERVRPRGETKKRRDARNETKQHSPRPETEKQKQKNKTIQLQLQLFISKNSRTPELSLFQASRTPSHPLLTHAPSHQGPPPRNLTGA